MKLRLKRFEFGTNYTIGRLYINDCQFPTCFTLEDKVREQEGVPVEQWKVQNETAIPVGTYKVIIDYSNHFKCDRPHILNVPGFEGIRIHPGNTDKDTDGCVLVGKYWPGGDFIRDSAMAFVEVNYEIQQALKAGEDVSIEIV